MADVEEKLKSKVLDWEEIRLVQDSKKTYFVSEERYNTGSTLFYTPVCPLYRLFHDKKRKSNLNDKKNTKKTKTSFRRKK